MIKQHSFPQSSHSFTTSSFYSCNLILPLHTQDSLVLHFFYQKCRLNFSLFCLSLFLALYFFPFCLLFFLFCLLFLFSLLSFVLFSLPSFFLFIVSLLSSFFFMPLSVATHCSFASFSHECPPFCTSFLFSFLLSSPSPLSLLSSFSLPIFSFSFSFLLLQEITFHTSCHSISFVLLFFRVWRRRSFPVPVSHLPSPSVPSPLPFTSLLFPSTLPLSLPSVSNSRFIPHSLPLLSRFSFFNFHPVRNLPFPTSTQPPCLRMNTHTHTHTHHHNPHPPRIKHHTHTHTHSH
ncbi:hypothetical protein K457DRAFT_1519775 [Linnemannia elongata AG-77]|uniref:Uncharacterized protein n=1 Tax=Linnemannia elongata AG-77 TaxID=1314771 RepID=A0A197JPG2_9FUNG|nr:hypothetical protein K457DRAFT_1519775 [Linnemannia elongata AG-77]